MADDTARFEKKARERVRAEVPHADLGVFAVSLDLVRSATRLITDVESAVHRPLGCTFAGFRVLFTLWVEGALEPRRIARLSGMSRAAVSAVLNTLERDGLVERRRDQADRRLVTVALTDAGRRHTEVSYRAQHERERALFGALSAAERRTLGALLSRLLAAPLPPPT